jgi:hypothetical protein
MIKFIFSYLTLTDRLQQAKTDVAFSPWYC